MAFWDQLKSKTAEMSGQLKTKTGQFKSRSTICRNGVFYQNM